MKKRITAAFAALTAVLLCLAACGSETAVVLRFAVETQAVTFDPQIAESGTAKMTVRNTFEGLVRPDSDGKISPGVAEKWDISPDGLTYTFYLREGAVWHVTKNAAKQLAGKLPEDFAPESETGGYVMPKVTANDFVFAFRRALDPATAAPDAELLTSIVNARESLAGTVQPSEIGVSAPDEKTLVIRLAERNDAFLSVLAEPVCMPCNETFFNACGGRYGLLIAYSLSNGPFYLSYFDETTYRLRKSADYTGEHAAKADTLWFYYNSDSDTVLQKLKNGEYSGAYVTDSQLKKIKVGKNDEVKRVADTNRVFLINNKNEKLAIKELRDAFLFATDTAAVAAGKDEEFGKDAAFLKALDKAPFYAVKVYPTTFGSAGGVTTTDQGRVTRQDGTVIPGMYAAGEMSNRYFYNENYILAASLGMYSTMGHRTGAAAAADALAK